MLVRKIILGIAGSIHRRPPRGPARSSSASCFRLSRSPEQVRFDKKMERCRSHASWSLSMFRLQLIHGTRSFWLDSVHPYRTWHHRRRHRCHVGMDGWDILYRMKKQICSQNLSKGVIWPRRNDLYVHLNCTERRKMWQHGHVDSYHWSCTTFIIKSTLDTTLEVSIIIIQFDPSVRRWAAVTIFLLHDIWILVLNSECDRWIEHCKHEPVNVLLLKTQYLLSIIKDLLCSSTKDASIRYSDAKSQGSKTVTTRPLPSIAFDQIFML